MNNIKQKNIQVYADWQGFLRPTLIGILHVTPGRGKEIFSFEYQDTWLHENKNIAIDPSLQLFQGPQYINEQPNFGVFLDASPDRWGRALMDRRL